jgi:pimeloyl-ACP methyl ester carboxylesterase
MATFLICHGAWSAGWAWKKVRPLLRAAGHEVFTPTYTGLGERAHHASPAVDLEIHIKDVLGVIEFEDLRNCILVGHSYGGMVATGVADLVPERIRHLIYLDAFVPGDGQSLLDIRGSAPRAAAASPDEDWLVPPNPPPPDTSEADLAWLAPRRRPQPVKTFSQSLHLRNSTTTFPRSYIYCTMKAPDDVFLQFSRRFKSDPAWRYFEIAASHSPNVTAPGALARLFCEIVS